jgi:hypothetical protein
MSKIGQPRQLLPACLLAFVNCLCAAPQVATVTSNGPFQLRGARVSTDQGVPSWPALAGDTIQAVNTSVAFAFADGSVVTLDPGSTAKVELSGQTPVFRLVCGTAHYTLKALNRLKLMAQNDAVTPTQVTGTYSTGSCKQPAGWWTTGHTLIVLAGAAAAAGLGLGIASATSGGSPLSTTP